MLHDELKKLGNSLKHALLKTKNSNKQQKHSGVLIPDEIKKLKRLNHLFFFLLLEHMMILIVACTKKYTKPEMTKTGFLD